MTDAPYVYVDEVRVGEYRLFCERCLDFHPMLRSSNGMPVFICREVVDNLLQQYPPHDEVSLGL